MARILALIPDLMFGSRVQALLAADGHEVELLADPARLGERLAAESPGVPAVLIVDLTDAAEERIASVQALAAAGALAGVRTLGFYSHVEAEVRARAQAAGFDQVVPRSRMAREGAQLLERLIASSRG
jgi:hypothetical protein